MHRALSASPVLEFHFLRLEALHRLGTHAGLKRRLHRRDDRAVDGVRGDLRLLDRNAGLEPSKQIDPVAPATLESREIRLHDGAHRHWHVHFRRDAECGAVEAVGRDADDGHRLAIDDHRGVEHGGVRAELGGPVSVAQHGDEVSADASCRHRGRGDGRAPGAGRVAESTNLTP